MAKRNRIHYGERFGVSAFVPPPKLAKAAAERTEGLVGYFLSCAHREGLKWHDDLYSLARSCYVQGVLDAANVAAEMLKEEKK
jgi:hypothetical protein